MKKTTIDKEAIVEELRKQDEQLKVILERREELAKLPKKQDVTTKFGKCFLMVKNTILFKKFFKNLLTNCTKRAILQIQ